MASILRTQTASLAGAHDEINEKSNIVLRTIIFVSVHVAFVGAGALIYSV